MERRDMKKAFDIIKNILVWLIVVLAACMAVFTMVSVSTFDQNHRSLFGYKAFIVRSDSMRATDFGAGDVIFVKEVDPSTLKEGDIIAYLSQNSSNYGETVTHKIRKLVTDADGEPGFITYGTTTDIDDETVVTYPYVLGRYTGNIPKVGSFFSFLKTMPGYILCILVPFLLLIGYQGFNCIRLFRQYRKEQLAQVQEERELLAQERMQSQEMLRELQELRRQLGMETSAAESMAQEEITEELDIEYIE